MMEGWNAVSLGGTRPLTARQNGRTEQRRIGERRAGRALEIEARNFGALTPAAPCHRRASTGLLPCPAASNFFIGALTQ